MAKYPEHEKLQQVKDDSQTVGEFLEWLTENGLTLCTYEEAKCSEAGRYLTAGETAKGEPIYIDAETGRESPNITAWNRKENPDYWYNPEGYYPTRKTIEQVLAEFFKIDLQKINAEKEAMYQELRAAANS